MWWSRILHLNFTFRAKSAVIKLNAFTLQRLAYKLFWVWLVCSGIRGFLCFCPFNLLKCLLHMPRGKSKSVYGHAWVLENLFPQLLEMKRFRAEKKYQEENLILIFSSVQFSLSVVSDSLQPHELQLARPPCPSPSPGVHSNSCPSSRWCHPAISSSVIPFSSCP